MFEKALGIMGKGRAAEPQGGENNVMGGRRGGRKGGPGDVRQGFPRGGPFSGVGGVSFSKGKTKLVKKKMGGGFCETKRKSFSYQMKKLIGGKKNPFHRTREGGGFIYWEKSHPGGRITTGGSRKKMISLGKRESPSFAGEGILEGKGDSKNRDTTKGGG